MTLLTLEEIEKAGSLLLGEIETSEYEGLSYPESRPLLDKLLATARAYWEKEPPEEQIESSSRGDYDYKRERAIKEAFEKGRAFAEHELKNKPHPATIRAIEGYNQEKNIIVQILVTTKDHYQRAKASSRLKEIDIAIRNLLDKSLEKHLK